MLEKNCSIKIAKKLFKQRKSSNVHNKDGCLFEVYVFILKQKVRAKNERTLDFKGASGIIYATINFELQCISKHHKNLYSWFKLVFPHYIC